MRHRRGSGLDARRLFNLHRHGRERLQIEQIIGRILRQTRPEAGPKLALLLWKGGD
jgi:hypothetical protein